MASFFNIVKGESTTTSSN